jgi:hypothetical protein
VTKQTQNGKDRRYSRHIVFRIQIKSTSIDRFDLVLVSGGVSNHNERVYTSFVQSLLTRSSVKM